MLGVDPAPNGAPHDLLERLGVPRSIGGGFLERFHDGGAHIVEDGVIRSKTTGVNLWADDDFSGLWVHRYEDGDEALLGENSPIFEVRFRNFPDG